MNAAVRWRMTDAAAWLRAPDAGDNKYSRGVVGMRTGSDAYPGAAVLGVQAAWRTGVGMVRYLGPDRAAALVLQRRPETVTAAGRVQAWVVGSGTDAATRAETETAAVRAVLDGVLPVVADAGALQLAARARAPRVLTPHAREHTALRAALGLDPRAASDAASRLRTACETAAATGATVLLKGAVTVVAAPTGWAATVEGAPAWLATAGTGDVLAGVLGALLAGAQARPDRDGSAPDAVLDSAALAPYAATAAWLHARAGAVAAARAGRGAGDGPITALEVADALPQAVAEALAAASGSAGAVRPPRM